MKLKIIILYLQCVLLSSIIFGVAEAKSDCFHGKVIKLKGENKSICVPKNTLESEFLNSYLEKCEKLFMKHQISLFFEKEFCNQKG